MPIPQLSQKKYQQSWKDKQKEELSRNSGKRKESKKSFYFKNLILNKKIFLSLLVLAFIFIFSGLGTIAWMSRDLPDPYHLTERGLAQSTKIYDRTGEILLYEIHGSQQRTLMTLDQIPNYMQEATISMEDKNFYKHSGFSILAIFRTIVTDIVYRKKAGASTITQQLVKNAILSPEKTFSRKIKELILAYRIEKKFSKDEILQMYLNEIPYGGTTYGVEAASRHYFGKSVVDISLAEAATLAALPQAPSFYSPQGPNKELLLLRKDYILKIMNEQDYISEQEMEEAQKEELKFRIPTSDIQAPHFVMFVKSVLSQKYGQKMLEQGGLKIYTTLDMYKQNIAKEAVEKGVQSNEERYNATNAGLVSIDPKTGQILAMIGSRNYFSDKIDGQFNVTTAKRQPGSSLKPLVYAALFEKGFTPNTKLFDVVTNFSNNPNNPYEPKNYNLKEHGLISIRKALAGSLNIPAVKALYLVGMDNVFGLLNQFGYSTFADKDRFGLSLVLGGGEVKLLEHTNAYGVFAREGVFNPITSILKIEDSKGNTLEEFSLKEKRVLPSETARMINSILSDKEARLFTFGTNNYLNLGNRTVGIKTGTTNDYKDAWTIGYTPSIVTGVWVGNNNGSQMARGASGGQVAAPIWNDFMKRVLGDTPFEDFKQLGDINTGKPAIDGNLSFEKTVIIDKASGLLATEHTPENYKQEATYKTTPHNILYYVDKNNPLGAEPEDPTKDPQFESWEKAVRRYALENEEHSTSSVPTEYDNVHRPEFKPSLEILSPKNKEVLNQSFLEIKLSISAPRGIHRVDYYINNQLLEQKTSFPFDLNYDINFLNNGYHDLKIRACDDVDNCSEETIVFNLNLENNNNGEKKVSLFWNSSVSEINITDLPLNLEINIEQANKVSKLEVFSELITATSSLKELVFSKTNPQENYLNFYWENLSQAGVYNITARAHTWENKIKESPVLEITVSN